MTWTPLLAEAVKGKETTATAQMYFEQVHRLQDQIAWLQTLVFALSALVVVQISVKFAFFVWMHGFGRRIERLLSLAEAHGAVSDAIGRRFRRGLKDLKVKADQTRQAAHEAAKTTTQVVRSAAETIPERVVERIAQAAGESGTNLPRPGDPGSGMRRLPGPLPEPPCPPERPRGPADSGTIDLGAKPPPPPTPEE